MAVEIYARLPRRLRLLAMTPSTNPNPIMSNQNLKSTKVLKRLLSNHVRPYKNEVIVAIFFMVVVAICSAAIVALTKPAIDRIFITHDKQMLFIIPLVMLGIYTIKGIAEYLHGSITKYDGHKILTDFQI